MYRDEWVRVEGVWLHYQDWPAREAPPDAPILLLHGLTQQSHTFDDLARRLSARRRCLALDVRGRGESSWAAPESYVMPQCVQDVRAFLRALGLPADRVAEYMVRAVRREPDGAWRLKWDPAIGHAPRPDAAVLAAAQRIWWDAFVRLRVPVLLVWGEESDILSRETAARMAGLQPGLVRVDVAGVGHAPTLLEPPVVAALDLFYGGARDGVPREKAALEEGSRARKGG